jgi:putative endonuclease
VPQVKPYYVYILECFDGTFYTGVTTDIDRRLDQHNGKRRGGAKYTRSRRPVRLAWKSLAVDRSFALRAEAGFKKMSHAKKRRLAFEYL